MHAYDQNTGLIFYSQVHRNGIGCWDTTIPLTPANFHLIAQDNTTMIYPSDINVFLLNAFRSNIKNVFFFSNLYYLFVSRLIPMV